MKYTLYVSGTSRGFVGASKRIFLFALGVGLQSCTGYIGLPAGLSAGHSSEAPLVVGMDPSTMGDSSVKLGKLSDADGNVSYVTNSAQINLVFDVIKATQMSVSSKTPCENTSASELKDTWTNYVRESSINLSSFSPDTSTSSYKVFVRFRGQAESSVSSCFKISFVLDTTPPVLTTDLAPGLSALGSSALTSFPVSGTCSEIDRKIELRIFDLNQNQSLSLEMACTSPGAYSQNVNLSSLTDSSYTLTLSQSDLAGNITTLQRAFAIDREAPTATSIVISGGASATNSSSVNLTLSASHAAQMYITNTAGCASGGSWESYTPTKSGWTLAQLNSTATVYAKFKSAGGNESACVNASIVHDNVAPTLTLTSPAANSLVNLNNQANFLISGGCSENGRTIAISGAASGVATCNANAWSANLNLSAASDGSLTVNLDFSDLAGNSSAQVSRSFVKDTSLPSGTAITIAGGAPFTNTQTVSLNLSSTGATEMYITNTAGCTAGGTWESFAATKSGWVLSQTNATATVFAKYRNSVLNETACVSDTIVHDNVAPTVAITSPAANTLINLATRSSFVVSGTCSENGRTVSVAPNGTTICNSGTWTTTVDFNSIADGSVVPSVTVTADLQDVAGNNAVQASRNFSADMRVPSSPSLQIAAGAAFTNSSTPALTLSATGASEMYVTNVAGCTSGGSWETYATSKTGWILGQSNAVATVYVKFRNTAQNESSCVGDTITHDSVPPTVAITSPSTGSYANGVNYTSFPVSGTCSEVGQNVTISGGANATVACQSNGVWSASLNFTSQTEGAIAISVAHGDLAGNAATVATLGLNLDITAPVLAISQPSGSNAYITPSNVAAYNFSGSCIGMEDGRTLTLKLGSSTIGTTACSSYSWTLTTDLSALPDATHSFAISGTDLAGNSGTPGSRSIVKDIVSPNAATSLAWSLSSPSNSTGLVASWTKSNSGDLSNQKIQFYSDNSCGTTSGLSIDLASAALQTRSFTGSNGGTYTYKVTSLDAAGNTSVSSCSSSMTLDTTPPAASSNLGWSQSTPTTLTGLTATWTKSASTDLYNQKIQFYTGASCTTVSGSQIDLASSATQSRAFTATAGNVYSYMVTSFDAAGNLTNSSCSSSITVNSALPGGVVMDFDVTRGNGTNFGGSSCATQTTTIANLGSGSTIGNGDLQLFDDVCTGANGGWKGSGTGTDPYRLEMKNPTYDYSVGGYLPSDSSPGIYVSASNEADLMGKRSSGSMDFWIRMDVAMPNSSSAYMSLFLESQPSANFAPTWGVSIRGDGVVTLSSYRSGWYGAYSNSYGFGTSSFHQITLTWSGTVVKFYFDGLLDKSVNMGVPIPTTITPLGPATIGKTQWQNNPFSGSVVRVRGYNSQISDTDVANLCQEMAPRFSGFTCR